MKYIIRRRHYFTLQRIIFKIFIKSQSNLRWQNYSCHCPFIHILFLSLLFYSRWNRTPIFEIFFDKMSKTLTRIKYSMTPIIDLFETCPFMYDQFSHHLMTDILPSILKAKYKLCNVDRLIYFILDCISNKFYRFKFVLMSLFHNRMVLLQLRISCWKGQNHDSDFGIFFHNVPFSFKTIFSFTKNVHSSRKCALDIAAWNLWNKICFLWILSWVCFVL